MSRTYWERECAPFTKCDATTPDFNEGVENELPPPVSAVRRLRRWPLRLGNCPLARSGGVLRSRRALELAARSRIVFDGKTWIVPSQTNVSAKYKVTIGEMPSCECEDFSLTRKPCKHVHAARLVGERDHGGKAPNIVADVVPKRPTYKQNWPAYSGAQQREKNRVQVLLADLCSGVVDPPRDVTGRKPIPLADRLFSVVFKVWSTLSSRRF